MKTGPFVHQPENKHFLKFESVGDTPRVFTVVLYEAYDAGIIGSEHNGIAILDNGTEDDAGMYVVAKNLLRGKPVHEQAKAFEAIKAMSSWQDFKTFLGSLPGVQHMPEDVADESADYPYEGNVLNLVTLGVMEAGDEKDIRSKDMIAAHESDDVPYDFPPIGRVGMIAELMDHAVHNMDRYGPHYFSWNVKIWGTDDSGHYEGVDNDKAFDDRWKEYWEENSEWLWNAIVEDCRRRFSEGEYTTYPGNDQGDYEFAFVGRSGGHLALTAVAGEKIAFESMADIGIILNGLPDADLAKLYHVVKTLDVDATPEKARQEFDYQLAFHRETKEEEWVEEAKMEAKRAEMEAEANAVRSVM